MNFPLGFAFMRLLLAERMDLFVGQQKCKIDQQKAVDEPVQMMEISSSHQP